MGLLLPCAWRFVLSGGLWPARVCSAGMVWGLAGVDGARMGGRVRVLGVCASGVRWTGLGRLAVWSGVMVGSLVFVVGWQWRWPGPSWCGPAVPVVVVA